MTCPASVDRPDGHDCLPGGARSRAPARSWPGGISDGRDALVARRRSRSLRLASWTRCRTIICISACWRVLFPQATLIHVRRDLRDVAVSCWMTHFRSIRWADDQGDLARRIRRPSAADGALASGAAAADP